MKRSPIKRKTPLVARTGLRRKSPLRSGQAPLHRTPIKAVSAKRQKQQPNRAAAERALGRDRHGWGECARCLGRTYVNGHERIRRSQGGDPTDPDCLLCIACNDWAAHNPRVAAWTGWLVTPKWPHDPHLGNGQAFDLFGHIVNFNSKEQ